MDILWVIGLGLVIGLLGLAGLMLLTTSVAALNSRKPLLQQSARWAIGLLGVVVVLDWLRALRQGTGNAWLTTGLLVVAIALAGLITVSRRARTRGQVAVPAVLIAEAARLLASGLGPVAAAEALRAAHPELTVALAKHAVARASGLN